MRRKPIINWRESDAEKLTKKVERFNAKIYRARSRHPELADILPDTIKKEDKARMIEEIKSAPRSDFNKTLNRLDRFTRKGAEQAVTNPQGVTVTKWEKREVQIAGQQLNRDRARERERVENLEATSRGESLGMKRGQMGSERLNELQPKKIDFNKVRNKTEWNKLKATVFKQASAKVKQEKLELYKMNYIKGMTRVLGDHAADAIAKLKKMPAELIVEVYYREQEATIKFVYEKQDMNVMLEVINDIWDEEVESNPDMLSEDNWTEAQEKALNDWINNAH